MDLGAKDKRFSALLLPLLMIVLALPLAYDLHAVADDSATGLAIAEGATWVLRGHVSEQMDATMAQGSAFNLSSTIRLFVSTEGPLAWLWQAGLSQELAFNLTVLAYGNLTSLKLDSLRFYLVAWASEEIEVAGSDIVQVGADLIEGPATGRTHIAFYRDFMWELVDPRHFYEPPWLVLRLDANFTAISPGGGTTRYQLKGYSASYMMAVPPGYWDRDVKMVFTLEDLDLERGLANITRAMNYTIDGHEVGRTDRLKNANITALRPWLEFLTEPYYLAHVEEPLPVTPVLAGDWQALGQDWLDFASKVGEELGMPFQPSFTMKKAILANRKVELASFGLAVPVNISYSWAGGSAVNQANGTYAVSWSYAAGTGTLMSVAWEEALSFSFSDEWEDGFYSEEGERSISYEAEVASASFEFGEPLKPPSLRIVSISASPMTVASGEVVAFEVVVANEGDLDAEGAVLSWSSPYFRGPNDLSFDVPGNGNRTVRLELTAHSDENVTATVSFAVLYGGEAHDTSTIAISIYVPVSPPALVLRSARLSADEVLVGGTVRLTVLIANEGERAAENVRVRWDSEGFEGDHEVRLAVAAGSTAKATFKLKAVREGEFAIVVRVFHAGELVGHAKLSARIAKAIEPTPTATTSIASGAIAGAVAAGISAATAGVSAVSGAVPSAVAAAAPTVPAAAPAAPPAAAPTAAQAREARPGLFSKVLSGIKYVLGRRKRKKELKPPRNSLKLTLGLVFLSAALAAGTLWLSGTPLSLRSLPISIFTSAIGFTLALSGLSLFARRLSFYRSMGIKMDTREKAYLALTLILGLWGAFSSALGLASVLVPYLATVPLAASALVVAAYTAWDMSGWL